MKPNHTHDARIAELHARGMSDREISRTIGASRPVVQRLRSRLGLPPLLKTSRPEDRKPKKKAPPPRPAAPPANPGGSIPKPTTQMDRFLAAFARVEYAKPEESERAKEAGRHGRLPSPPVVTPLFSSSLERC